MTSASHRVIRSAKPRLEFTSRRMSELVKLQISVTNWAFREPISLEKIWEFPCCITESPKLHIATSKIVSDRSLLAGNQHLYLLQGGSHQLNLSSLPSAMQSSKLPTSCCNKIEKMIRDFLWGSNELQKKISLIKWDSMCQPLQHGGCGLKDIESQKKAFLMKIGYGIVSKPDLLWV